MCNCENTASEKYPDREVKKDESDDRPNYDSMAWDSLPVEQKVERMRMIIKGIQQSLPSTRRNAVEALNIARNHSHKEDGSVVVPVSSNMGTSSGEVMGDLARLTNPNFF